MPLQEKVGSLGVLQPDKAVAAIEAETAILVAATQAAATQAVEAPVAPQTGVVVDVKPAD